MTLKGTLIPIGGKYANSVIIPTASSIPVEVGENYISAFTSLDCENGTVLDIPSKEESESQRSIDIIKKSANCIMFSEGDQSKITNKIGGTTIHKIRPERIQYGVGFVIAGTTAGAMGQGKEMIAEGRVAEAFVKGAVTMYKASRYSLEF